MAKQPSSKSGSARIRFIMVDAEIPNGDLSQITTAIQNALKPTIIQQRIPSHAPASALTVEGSKVDVEEAAEEPLEADEMPRDVPRKPRPTKLRKPSSPKVIPLELKGDFSLESFVHQHTPNTDRDRNLVVAAFFKEHRAESEITVNHVYTCYRHMGWSTSIDDFGSTLRSLKKEQLVDTPSRGSYAINHIGLDRVLKLGGE